MKIHSTLQQIGATQITTVSDGYLSLDTGALDIAAGLGQPVNVHSPFKQVGPSGKTFTLSDGYLSLAAGDLKIATAAASKVRLYSPIIQHGNNRIITVNDGVVTSNSSLSLNAVGGDLTLTPSSNLNLSPSGSIVFNASVVSTTDDGYAINARNTYSTDSTAGAAILASGTRSYGLIVESDHAAPERAPLRITPQDINPSLPQQGDIYINKNSGLPSVYRGDVWSGLSGLVFATTSDSSANTGTSASKYDQRYWIPANSVRVGTVIKIRAANHVTSMVGGTASFTIRYGTANGTFISEMIQGDRGQLETQLVCRSVGSSGTFALWGFGLTYVASTTTFIRPPSTNTITQTTESAVEIHCIQSVTAGTISAILTQLTVEIAY